MDTLVKALSYALGIVGVTGLLIYVLALIYQALRLVERRFPRIWLMAGMAVVLAGMAAQYFMQTAIALLLCTAGLLLMAIGVLLWWLERQENQERSGDDFRDRRIAPRL